MQKLYFSLPMSIWPSLPGYLLAPMFTELNSPLNIEASYSNLSSVSPFWVSLIVMVCLLAHIIELIFLACFLSLLQTSKLSMTSFYLTSFICSSVRATLTIFSMTSALAQKLAC